MYGRGNVLKNLSWLTLGPLLRLGIGIPLAGFTAAHLGLDGYGAFTLAFSFAVMFGVLANLGINDVLVRAVAQHPEQAQLLWSSAFAFKLLLLAGYVAFVTVLAWLLGYSPELLWLVFLLSAMQGSISLDNSTRAVFIGREQARVSGLADIVKVLLETVSTVGILLLGYGAVALAGVRLATALIMVLFTLSILARRLRVRFHAPRFSPVRSLLPAGLRFASVSVIQSLYDRLGIILLGHFIGAQAVALFGAAAVFTDKITWFLPSVQGAIFPVFSRLHASAHERVNSAFSRALRYQTVLAVGCGLGVSVLGPWAIRLIFPEKFWPAGAIVVVLGWVCTTRSLNSFFVTILQSLGKERQASWIAAAQCALCLGSTVVFLWYWGLAGFPWAYILAETTAVALQVAVLKHAGVFSEENVGALLMTLADGLLVFGAVFLLPGGKDNLALTLALLLCYPLLLVMTRRISREDVRYLQGLWTSKEPVTA